MPLLCDSTAKGGRLPQATRGCLCSTNPCALIGAVHCGAPTYRARSLTPAPVAPTLPRSHVTRYYTYCKGIASASHPCKRSVTCPLRLVVLRRLRGHLRASAWLKTPARVTSALHPRALQRSPTARYSACTLQVWGALNKHPCGLFVSGGCVPRPPHFLKHNRKDNCPIGCGTLSPLATHVKGHVASTTPRRCP